MIGGLYNRMHWAKIAWKLMLSAIVAAYKFQSYAIMQKLLERDGLSAQLKRSLRPLTYGNHAQTLISEVR